MVKVFNFYYYTIIISNKIEVKYILVDTVCKQFLLSQFIYEVSHFSKN